MFWIHGGGFLSGEGALYQPNILLDRDVVLVTFNYRLGPLGEIFHPNSPKPIALQPLAHECSHSSTGNGFQTSLLEEVILGIQTRISLQVSLQLRTELFLETSA